MNYRRLGRSGLKVSTIILGTMNFGDATPKEEAVKIIDAALDEGINCIDCADIYAGGKSEEIVGEALKRGAKRDKVLITTKVFWKTGDNPNDGGNTKHHIIEECNRSLKRLKTDYIDIYFLHRTDFNVPQEESLEALDLLVKQGKVRYIGCSTHPVWRIVEAFWIAELHNLTKFVCEEPPYNLLERRIENELIPACKTYDLGIITWSPLAQGLLAGNYQNIENLPEGSRATRSPVYRERITKEGIKISRKFAEFSKKIGITPAQFAVSWVLHQEGITGTIIGPRTLYQFKELIKASDIKLGKRELNYCDKLVPPGQFVSNHFNTSLWMK
ncbi:MAG: aldo/keto reductase [Spirochaetes bacterium]|nr:MAG: aldo/keto reductase [Spirochaetota bacterium]